MNETTFANGKEEDQEKVEQQEDDNWRVQPTTLFGHIHIMFTQQCNFKAYRSLNIIDWFVAGLTFGIQALFTISVWPGLICVFNGRKCLDAVIKSKWRACLDVYMLSWVKQLTHSPQTCSLHLSITPSFPPSLSPSIPLSMTYSLTQSL